jgi:hypothetical protein
MTSLTWVGGSSSSFNDPRNWQPSVAPGPSSDVVVKPATATAITTAIDTTINSFAFNPETTLNIASARSFTVRDVPDAANPTGTSTNAGTVNLAASVDTFLFGTVANTGSVNTAANSDFWVRGTLDNGGRVAQAGDLHIGGVGAGSVVNETGAQYSVTGAVDLITGGSGGGTFTNDGAFVRGGTGSTDVTVAYVNLANVTVGSGALHFLGSVSNAGTMTAASASMSVSAAVKGTGMLDISAGGSMRLGAGPDIGQTVDFMTSGARGVLALAVSGTFGGTIAGFAAHNSIDLVKTPATSESFAGGVLTVKDGTTTVASLHFSGSYATSSFHLAADGHGGTFVNFV